MYAPVLSLALSSLSAPPLPLTWGLTLALALAQEKQLLGERRFRQIESVELHLAGKVTGMLLWPLDRATHSGGTLPYKVPTSSRNPLIVAAVSCAIFVPLAALGLRQRVESVPPPFVDHTG